jgi:hypothetical protein
MRISSHPTAYPATLYTTTAVCPKTEPVASRIAPQLSQGKTTLSFTGEPQAPQPPKTPAPNRPSDAARAEADAMVADSTARPAKKQRK